MILHMAANHCLGSERSSCDLHMRPQLTWIGDQSDENKKSCDFIWMRDIGIWYSSGSWSMCLRMLRLEHLADLKAGAMGMLDYKYLLTLLPSK